MLKFLFILVGFFAFSSPVISKNAEVKSKKSISKKINSRNSASENLESPFSCEVITQTQSGKQSSKVILNDELELAGTEAHQQVKIFSKDGIQGMTVNSFFESPEHPYTIDSISCDSQMRCEGKRVKYQKTKTIPQQLNIVQAYDGTNAVLGNAVIFKYATISNGFRLQNIQLEMDAYKAIGVTITCQGK